MRRKLVILTVAVLAVMLLATPGLVAAKGGHGGGGQGGAYFNLRGDISEGGLDETERTILVNNITSPGSLAGESILVYTTGDTRFKNCVFDPVTGTYINERIDYSGLVEGREVKIVGKVIDGLYVATSVIQYVP